MYGIHYVHVDPCRWRHINYSVECQRSNRQYEIASLASMSSSPKYAMSSNPNYMYKNMNKLGRRNGKCI